MRLLLLTASVISIVSATLTAQADTITSRVVSYDLAKRQLHLSDKTIIELDAAKLKLTTLPKAGDLVRIDYLGSENGIDKIRSVQIIQ